MEKTLKEILNVKEVSELTGMSISYIYKLTHTKQLTCYKPNGKLIFFKRSEVESWLLSNKKEVE